MPKQAALPSTLPPRLVMREAAAAYVCLSPNPFDEMIADGRMPKPRILGDRRKAWDVRKLDAAVDTLPHVGDQLADVDEGGTNASEEPTYAPHVAKADSAAAGSVLMR
jgi:predicted DNA-binding transcriptional regulator AlpA